MILQKVIKLYLNILFLRSSFRPCLGLVFLAKTKETFKVAELQYLEADLQAQELKYDLSRLLVDRSTGSTLLQFTSPDNNSILRDIEQQHLPSSLRRCDWVAQILKEGRSPENLIDQLRQEPLEVGDHWALDYIRMDDATNNGSYQGRRPNYTMKTLLCSISQTLTCLPALNPMAIRQRLILVDTGVSCFLVKRIPDGRDPAQDCAMVLKQWAGRPFQYSSAINMNVAEIVIDFLSGTTESSKQKVTLLDPTCGSGTFLAFAIAKGMNVEAFDCNPSCVQGSLRNLGYLFGDERIDQVASVNVHDSTKVVDGCETEIDCVVANLPWGVNSIEYLEENWRILDAVRSRISTAIPCAFVTRDPSLDLFRDTGFEVVGQAYVPQREFTLPKGKKKRDSVEIERNNRNRCVVTFARSA